MGYVIKTPKGFVSGFSEEHQIVQIAGSDDQIKHFTTPLGAQMFINHYAEAGYGLTESDIRIEYKGGGW